MIVVTRCWRPRTARPRAAPAWRRSSGLPSPTPTSCRLRAPCSAGTSGTAVTLPGSEDGSWAAPTEAASRPRRAIASATGPSMARPPSPTGRARTSPAGRRWSGRRRAAVRWRSSRWSGGEQVGGDHVRHGPSLARHRRDEDPRRRSAGGGHRQNVRQVRRGPHSRRWPLPVSASSGVISTRGGPTLRGMRRTIPRPSLVTSSGPSPVLGFIAAHRVSPSVGVEFSWARGSTPVLSHPDRAMFVTHYPVNCADSEIQTPASDTLGDVHAAQPSSTSTATT